MKNTILIVKYKIFKQLKNIVQKGEITIFPQKNIKYIVKSKIVK